MSFVIKAVFLFSSLQVILSAVDYKVISLSCESRMKSDVGIECSVKDNKIFAQFNYIKQQNKTFVSYRNIIFIFFNSIRL